MQRILYTDGQSRLYIAGAVSVFLLYAGIKREVDAMPLLCGTGKAKITPPDCLLRRLLGLKQHRFAGVLDDLWVRALVLGNEDGLALLLSFDMTAAPCTESFLTTLSQTTGIPTDCILAFAIHTHSVPFNDIDLEERDRQSSETLDASSEYTRFLHAQAVAAAKNAVQNVCPARMGWAFGESRVNVVRLQDYIYHDKAGAPFTVCNLGADYTRFADPTLFTLRVENLDGAPIAFLVNYPMHNVTTIWNDFNGQGAMGISGDVGGRISRLLEMRYPGSVALWSSGAAGDLNPIMLNEVILPDPLTGRAYEYHPIGLETARTALLTVSERHYADILQTLSLVRRTEEDGSISAAMAWSRTPGVACIRRKNAPPEFRMGSDVPEHTVCLQMVKIGGLTLLGAGAELYSSIGRGMLRAAGENTVLITHNASTLCSSHYVLDDETIARCDASRGFAMVPGYDEYRCLAGVMEQDLVNHVRQMRKQLEGDIYET